MCGSETEDGRVGTSTAGRGAAEEMDDGETKTEETEEIDGREAACGESEEDKASMLSCCCSTSSSEQEVSGSPLVFDTNHASLTFSSS